MASEFVAKPLPRKPQPPCASGDVTALLLQNGRYQRALDVAHSLVNTHVLARSRLLLKQQDETPYNALKLPDVPRKWELFEKPSHH